MKHMIDIWLVAAGIAGVIIIVFAVADIIGR